MMFTARVSCFVLWISLIPTLTVSLRQPYRVHVSDPQQIIDTAVMAANNETETKIVTSCKAFQQAYSLAAANLSSCFITASRPFCVCRQCVREYLEFNSLYKIINDDNVDTGLEKVNCRDLLIRSDHVQMLFLWHKFVIGTWGTSLCRQCYTFDPYINANKTVVANLTDLVIQFMDLRNRVESCFDNYTYAANSSANSSACEVCKDVYGELSSLYLDMESTSETKMLCMDVMDMMNITRKHWSDDLECDSSKRTLQPIPAIVVGYLFIVFFYLGARGQGEIKRRKLLRQKRLANFIGSGSLSSSLTPSPPPNM